MNDSILAAIIGGFVGGIFAVIAALIALYPYIKQLKVERKERERQRIRDEELPSIKAEHVYVTPNPLGTLIHRAMMIKRMIWKK